VVDLDRMAMELGYLTTFEKQLVTYQTLLRDDLKGFDAAYKAQIQAYIKTLVPASAEIDGAQIHLTPEQQAELKGMVTASQTQMAALAKQGDQEFAKYRGLMLTEYRRQLSPLVRDVARQNHVDLVLIQSENVLTTETTID